jgi:transposase
MRAVSTEKRLLLVSAKERRESTEDIAKWLDISKHTIKLIWKVYKKTGSIEPKTNQGRKSCMSEEHEACIREKIKAEPDATLQEIIDDLKLPIKKSQLHRWLSKNGYSYKKNSSCKQCPQRRCCYKATKLGRDATNT